MEIFPKLIGVQWKKKILSFVSISFIVRIREENWKDHIREVQVKSTSEASKIVHLWSRI